MSSKADKSDLFCQPQLSGDDSRPEGSRQDKKCDFAGNKQKRFCDFAGKRRIKFCDFVIYYAHILGRFRSGLYIFAAATAVPD